MVKGYLLTDEERELLRTLLVREKQASKNTRNRPDAPEEDPPAPEVYLAWTTSSIPARRGATVRAENCDIYRIIGDTVVLVSGLFRLVYNPYPSTIPAGRFIKVTRDKFGRWLAECPCGDEVDDETGTGTGLFTGTGTGTFTNTGTSTDTAEGCDPVTVTEQDVRCEDGSLNVYSRTVWLDIVNGCLSKLVGSWTFLRAEGCCECTEDVVTGTGGTGTADDLCDCITLPNYYVAYVNGFTTCTSFNGFFSLARSGNSCTYYATSGTVTGTLVLTSSGSGNQFRLTLNDSSTGKQVVYTGQLNSSDCCRTVDLSYTSGDCGTHPTAVTIYPGTPCLGDTGTAGNPDFETGTGTIDSFTGTGDGGTINLSPCGCETPFPLYASFTGVGHTTGCLHGVNMELTDILGTGVNLRDSVPCGINEVTLEVKCEGAFTTNLVVSLYCNGVLQDSEVVSCPTRPVNLTLSLTSGVCDTVLDDDYTVHLTE